MMLRHVGGVAAQVQLYRAFGPDSSVADWLRRAILRNVRTPADVVAVRAGLGLDVPVDWDVFARLWRDNEDDPERRLAIVRRWLEVVPEEMDLRLKLLSLLEQVDRMAEARRLARELRADPLADARVRTMVGEFWLRQEDEDEARRIFSEIVENAPLDPWARKRLGDLYRAHGWADDAYREYQTLARLRPGDGATVLDLARAAADAGRVDEALRLEQRLSETADSEVDEGAAGFARLWTQIRLARLKLDAVAELAEMIRRRERETGALRDPPAILALLSWSHPDDAPELWLRHPSTPVPAPGSDEPAWERAPLAGGAHGVEAVPIREREDGDYLFELRREERDRIRDVEAELLVLMYPGTSDERILRHEVRLTRRDRKLRLKLTDGALEEAPIPASEREDRGRAEP
jgi:Ca-activated chloride channel family protein